jgi:putative membrane protein
MFATLLPALLSAFHVLALGIGLGAVYARGRALRRADVPAVLQADMLWGIAAMLWIASGLARAFGGFEKGTAWYLANPMFHLKITLFVVVLLLEVWPMTTFIKWRMARGQPVDTSRTHVLARVNDVELAIVVLIPFVAAIMARGVGF